jgi:hypothetical protein
MLSLQRKIATTFDRLQSHQTLGQRRAHNYRKWRGTLYELPSQKDPQRNSQNNRVNAMVYNYKLRIGLTRNQVEKIKQDAERHGFEKLSQYVRWFILDRSTETEEKIHSIYRLVKEGAK